MQTDFAGQPDCNRRSCLTKNLPQMIFIREGNMNEIDYSRLSRDFSKEPIRRGEVIPKSDVEYLYIELNLNRPDTAKALGTCEMGLRRLLKVHNIKKPRTLYMKKAKATCMKRFGVASPLKAKEIRDMCQKSLKQHYGVDNYFSLPGITAKLEKTKREKYGDNYMAADGVIRKKITTTMRKRYGVSSGMQVHVTFPEIWYNDERLTEFIKAGNSGSKWTTEALATYFNLTVSPVQVRIGEVGLWSYINLQSSKEEKELYNLLQSWGEHPVKYKTPKLELDIYLPDKQIAIEFNGNYWHSTRIGRGMNYHLNKTIKASLRGIRVYHIFEYEWMNRKTQIINQIRNMLGHNQETIYARKCVIKEVLSDNSSDFQNANHIQGSANASVHVGLYSKDELVALMTFGKSRFNKKIEWELVRFCSKAGTNVVGGASRLFKYFVKTYKPSGIISYSDIAKTTGNLYTTLGFSCIDTAEPNYVWVYHDTVLSRYQCQKHRLIAQGFGHLGKTEKEIMENRNFAQVYDCGSRVHIWGKYKDLT